MSPERTVRADARANRERIVEAAASLYAEEGLDVSFNAIAQRAGVGSATLYRHFPHHDELRQAVYLARVHESTVLLSELASSGDPATELCRYLTWTFHTADLSLIGLGMTPGTGSAELQEEARRVKQLLDELIGRAHAAGVLSEGLGRGDVLVAAAALVQVARNEELPSERKETFLGVVLRGLGLTD
ncbi:helix-turn-helix domain containing protein [Nocardioides sp. BP30]|uniref:TetR/AcrR family transcriptional regulator n=1 Tax=Nocardioides sp. BP30 TaxID=3036374 RepID=UPI0024695BCB|nr:helix-turn-helix domain-containing protein [Nocardioides sp. BP30]WGL51071.1 helix-turn-helix domain containing protein [Nocardioides sp. BP30]